MNDASCFMAAYHIRVSIVEFVCSLTYFYFKDQFKHVYCKLSWAVVYGSGSFYILVTIEILINKQV